MKKLIGLLILLACCWTLNAKPARGTLVEYTQPDGSVILIRPNGDEWGHWITDQQGRVVSKDAEGYYRVVEGVDAGTMAQLAQVRRQAMRQAAASRNAVDKAPVPFGQKHFLLVLVAFSDVDFTISDPQQTISDMLNQEGYSDNGATGSARDYYYENSNGQFEPIFDVVGPVTLTNTMEYYGGNDSDGNDKRPHYAVKEACEALDDSVDFSDYDIDGDGEVDLVYMVYAGQGEADSGDEDTIWPHQWYLSSGDINLKLDGKTIDRYACGSELNYYKKLEGIGTICHEFGHAIGLPDFYDTDYETNGLSAGVFAYSLMCMGTYNNNGWTPPYLNLIERVMLGWQDESALVEIDKSGSYTLDPVQNNVCYKTSTDNDGEYFIYECRSNEGWDIDVPAPGLVVYHVDKSDNEVSIKYGGWSYSFTAAELWDDWESTNSINANGTHPCYYIVPSADQDNLSFGYKYYSQYGAYYYDSSNDPKIPFPGKSNVKTYTAVSWSGEESQVSLSDIAYSSNQVSFTATVASSGAVDYPLIANPGEGVYTAGADFALELVVPGSYSYESVTWYYDGTQTEASSVTLTQGSHSIQALLQLSSGKSLKITLEVEAQ